MPAARQIVQIALVVRDYDEAIEYYTRVLGFALLEDEDRGGGKRWVRMAPTPDGGGIGLLLAKAVGDEQASRIGNQTGGRVFLFLQTDNFAADHARLVANGVTFLRGPIDEPYGRVAVFADLYGNKWDLIEPSPKSAPPSW